MSLVAVAIALGVGGLIGLAAREGRRHRRDGQAAWQQAAGELGGVMRRSPADGLRVRLDGVDVLARVSDHVGVRVRQTTVHAVARVRPGLRLAVGTRRRRLQPIALDPQTNAWTDRPRHLAERWTAGDTQRWHRAATGPDGPDPTCRLTSDGAFVTLTIDGVVEDAARLIAAIELVARIASDDLGVVDALAQLPGAIPVPGELAVRIAPGDLLVEIDHRGWTAITGIAALSANATTIRSAEELARAKARWATPELGAVFTASGAARLSVSLGEARLAWLKRELDPARLRAGLELMRRIAGVEDTAPYR